MSEISFSARYHAAMAACGGGCPIEAGLLGRLADNECRHARLPFDRTAACGCWPQEVRRYSRSRAPARRRARTGAPREHQATDRRRSDWTEHHRPGCPHNPEDARPAPRRPGAGRAS